MSLIDHLNYSRKNRVSLSYRGFHNHSRTFRTCLTAIKTDTDRWFVTHPDFGVVFLDREKPLIVGDLELMHIRPLNWTDEEINERMSAEMNIGLHLT